MILSEEQIRIIEKYPLKDLLSRFPAKLHDLQTSDNPGGGGARLEQLLPLARCIVANSPDIEIWSAVFALIDALSPPTPPTSSVAPTFKGTPVKSSSSRQRDARDHRERAFPRDQGLHLRNVGRFCDKFFNPKGWCKEQRAILEAVMAEYDGKKWMGFPTIPNEQPVWSWLRSLEELALADAPHKLYTTKTAHHDKFEHKDVLVVGEQKKSYDSSRFKADLLQLTRYIRDIIDDQPTRRFVHAFTLCASMMELWLFDRSGAYSSGSFDIHDKPDTFARALVGYATMDDEPMGLDLFIERETDAESKEHRHVTLDDANDNATRVRLVEAMVRQKAVVCRGTTCFRTGSNHFAKFSWASDKRKLEVEQLRLAGKRGVKGVARVVAHRQITTIAELREGLDFQERHKFRSEEASFEDPPSVAKSTSRSSNKRKSSSDHASDVSGSKRRRSSSQKSKLSQKLNEELSVGKVKPSLNYWRQCEMRLRHISHYKTGNILHRDISSNNIIITEPEAADGFKGVLIDLSLAKVKDSSPSGARHQTGMMQFMAVEVLRTVDHTYRHDLESFFYVLLWMCARQAWHNGFAGRGRPPKESLLRKWEIGSFREIASAKRGHMTVDGMDEIMDEFPGPLDVVKPLCLKIRTILFGNSARLVLGTPAGEPDELYEPIIAAYDDTVGNL
uniref:EKC/KEOPS complex subunit BUD32 n=1 Tax=Bionectria ochroleuca TaxID=29856 RepID=A0A0B7K8U1_BIOOC